MKKNSIKAKGFIFLLLYLCSIVNLNGISSAQINDEDIYNSAEIWNKIDSRLYSKINDPNSQDEFISLIVMFNVPALSKIDFPSSVIVVQYYFIMDGAEISSPVGKIFEIALMPEIKSIWWNLPYESDSDSYSDPNIFLKSANANLNPYFANFTSEIHATDLWKDGYRGKDVIIAVLDTGVDITGSGGGDLDDIDDNNETTDPKYLGGVSMVPEEPLYYSDLNGRGTFHAGVACGTGAINSSYIGVAPEAYYLNVKIYDSIGITYWSFIISGIEWAITHGADILLFAYSIPGLYLDPVCQAVDRAVEKGIFVVAPIGDDGPGYMSTNTPGQSNKAFVVGAYNSFTGEVWNKSSRGPSFDFAVGPDAIAPGVGLIGPRSRIFSADSLDMLSGAQSMAEEYGLSTLFDFDLNIDFSTFSTAIPTTMYGEDLPGEGNYTRSSGSGAAAAVVAGAAALLMSAFPLASPVFIHQALIEGAVPVNDERDLNAEGAGLINVQASFEWLKQRFMPNQYKILPTSVPLVYAGIVTCSDYANVSQYSEFQENQLLEYDITSLLSTQAMMTALVVSNSSQQDALNMTSIHLPLNQFGFEYGLSDNPEERQFHWFSEFNVVREFHQMINAQMYQEGYKRYIGILGLDGLYVSVIAETWSYAGSYLNTTFNVSIPNPYYNFTLPTEYNLLNITDRVNAIKFSFNFINQRDDLQDYIDTKLVSYFKADLYLNETGLASEYGMNNIDSALNFSYDDTIRYNSTNQMVWVEDYNNSTFYVSEDKYTAMGFSSETHPIYRYAMADSIGLLLNLTLERFDAPDWNKTTDQFDVFEGSPGVDPGFATAYNLSNIPYGQRVYFAGALGVGQGNSMQNARDILNRQNYLIFENVTDYPINDLMVITANFSRNTNVDDVFSSKVKIINLGTETLPETQLGFAVNRSNENDVWEVSSTIFIVRNLAPFEIREFTASWVPLEAGVYTIAWVFGDFTDIYAIQNEANLLSNTLARTIFVLDKYYYDDIKYDEFSVYPMKLAQNPMKIYAPLDFGLYNLTCLAIREMKGVRISTDGLGQSTTFFVDLQAALAGNTFQAIKKSYTTDLLPYSSIFLVLIGNPICPPGIIRFNVTFTAQGESEPFYRLPVEIQLYPNRGRIWFDATHLNFFVSDNYVGTGALSGLLNSGNMTLSNSTNNTFGNFGDIGDFSFDGADGFDITRFIDLNERMDHTWGSFFKLRELWAEPESNHGKGASLFTIIPFIELNVTQLIGFDISEFSLNSLIPDTSFLGRTLGDYYFESDVITTNFINHDVLQFFDGLVINDPEQAFLEKEIVNITSWVEKGGTLYVFAEDIYHNNIPSLNELLAPFSLRLENESIFPFNTYGYKTFDLSLDDKVHDLFSGANISTLQFKDPVKVTSLDPTKSELLCEDMIGVSHYGLGRVIVVGDNDIFKELLIDKEDNEEFARQVLRFGQENYYKCELTATPSTLKFYENGYVNINFTDVEMIEEKNLTSKGFLFVAAFFFEDGTLFNASLYGMTLPAMPMFNTDGYNYAIFLSTEWYLKAGNHYILMILDHPAGVSDMFYVRFQVFASPPPPIIERYQIPSPAYPHVIDIVGIILITYMGLVIWYYDLEKYRTRLRITQLKGENLNIAQTRLNEGKTLVKLLLRGLEKGDVEDIERMRFLLSNRKRLTKYFKDLKKFGDRLGEHY